MANETVPLLFFGLGLALAVIHPPAGHAQLKPIPRISMNVKLTEVPVTVFNDKGAVATNLDKSNFRIVEDGIEQRVLYLDKERQPVSFVILADVSQSMTNKIPFLREAGLSLVDSLPGTDRVQDELSLFSFESRARLLIPFTHDQSDFERRIPLLLSPTGGGTALFDAIYIGVTEAHNHAHYPRRAVVIISDGGDNHSRYNFRETKQLLEEADVPVFAVMAGPLFELSDLLPLPAKKPQSHNLPLPTPATDFVGPNELRGPRTLRNLTEVTGGGVFTAYDLNALPRIVQAIGQAVRYQYVLSYEPQRLEKNEKESKWHTIHLELYPKGKFDKYSVRYKRGYYANE